MQAISNATNIHWTIKFTVNIYFQKRIRINLINQTTCNVEFVITLLIQDINHVERDIKRRERNENPRENQKSSVSLLLNIFSLRFISFHFPSFIQSYCYSNFVYALFSYTLSVKPNRTLMREVVTGWQSDFFLEKVLWK